MLQLQPDDFGLITCRLPISDYLFTSGMLLVIILGGVSGGLWVSTRGGDGGVP